MAELGIFASCLGIFTSTLGLTSMAIENFALPNPYGDTTIRIYAGLDHEGLNDAGGELPDTTIFNAYGDQIGWVYDPGEYLYPGSHQDYRIGHKKKYRGQQAFYSLFTADRDAICIAYSTLTWAGEKGHLGAMIGDFGKQCSKLENSWYYSGVAIPGTTHIPACFWIDLDGDHPYTALWLNWWDMQTYPNDTRLGLNVDELGYDVCNSPTFSLYTIPDYKGTNPSLPVWGGPPEPKPQPKPEPSTKPRPGPESEPESTSEPVPPREVKFISGPQFEPPPSRVVFPSDNHQQQRRRRRGTQQNDNNNNNNSGKQQQQQNKKRTAIERYSDTVVLDDWAHHTAHELCTDRRSAGPSFVNPDEGLFCEMTTRTLYPVCTADGAQDGVACFDIDQMHLVGPGVTKRSAPYKLQNWKAQREIAKREQEV